METSDYLMMQSMQAAASASRVEPAVTTGQPDHQLRKKQDVDGKDGTCKDELRLT